MCLAARYACRLIAMSRWIVLAAFSTALSLVNVAQAEKCLTVNTGTAREIGRLKSDGREKTYGEAFGARSGDPPLRYISR
jgi:hypothetical protein